MAEAAAVICLGNRARSDDAVGPLIAEELSRHHPDVPVHISEGEPGELLELWSQLSRAILVDAVLTGRTVPGTLHVFEVTAGPLPVRSHASSHGIGIPETIELARALHRLPDGIRLIGIEAGSLEPGTALTPAVAAAIPEAVARIVEEMNGA